MPFYNFDENGRTDAAAIYPETVQRAIVAVGGTIVTKSKVIGGHAHRKAQLVLNVRGTVRCEAEQNVWIVPPHCAAWIPSKVSHSLTFAGAVKACVLFIDPEAAASLPTRSCTLSISPLLEQMLLYVAGMPVYYEVDGADGRFVSVLLDRLSAAPVEKLNLPMPNDPKLQMIMTRMMVDPSNRATIADWSRQMSISPRTLARTLQRETGMSFGRWRQQLHILLALQRLAEGALVQTVALELGYESPSAFITMFRKVAGKPPARYLAERPVSM